MRIGPDGGASEPVAPPKPKTPPPAPKKSAPASTAARTAAPARSVATAPRYVSPPSTHYVPPVARVTLPLPHKGAAAAKATVDAIGHRSASPLDDIGHFLGSLVAPPPKPVAVPTSGGYTALKTSLPVDPATDRAILAEDEAIATRDEVLAKQRDRKQSADIALGLNQTLAAVRAKTGVIAIPTSLHVDPNADLAQYRQAQQDARHDDLIAQEPVQQAKAKLATAQRALAATAGKHASAAGIAQAEHQQIAAAKVLAALRVGGGELFGGLGHFLGLGAAPSSAKLQKAAAANEDTQIAQIETDAKNGTIRRELEQSYVAGQTTSQQKALALAQSAARESEAADARQVAAAKADIGHVNLETDVSTAAKAQATLAYNKIAAQHDAAVIVQQHDQKLQGIQTRFNDEIGADKNAEIKQLGALPANASKASKLEIVSQTQALAKLQQTQAQLEFDAANTAGKGALTVLQDQADNVAAGGDGVLFRANAAAFSQPLMDQVAKQQSGGQSYASGAELNNFVVNSYLGQIPRPGASSATDQYTQQQLKSFGAAVKQIQSIGGQNGKILALPVLYDAGKGVQHTILFQVAKSGGDGSRFVDLSGKTYSSIDDFQHNNGIGDGGHLAVLGTTSDLQIERDQDGSAKVFVGKSHIDPGLLSAAIGDLGTAASFVGGVAVGALKFGAKLVTKDLPEIAEDAAPIVEGVAMDAGGGALEVVTDGAATPLAAMMEEDGTGMIVTGVAEDGARMLAGDAAKTVVDDGAKTAVQEEATGAASKLASPLLETTAKSVLAVGNAANAYSGVADLKNMADHGQSWSPFSSTRALMDSLNVVGSVSGVGSAALDPAVSSLTKTAEDGTELVKDGALAKAVVRSAQGLGATEAVTGGGQALYQAGSFALHPSWASAKGLAIGLAQMGTSHLANAGVKRYYEASGQIDPPITEPEGESAPQTAGLTGLSGKGVTAPDDAASFGDALKAKKAPALLALNPALASVLPHLSGTVRDLVLAGGGAGLSAAAILKRDKVKAAASTVYGGLKAGTAAGGRTIKRGALGGAKAIKKTPGAAWGGLQTFAKIHPIRRDLIASSVLLGGTALVADVARMSSPEATAIAGGGVLFLRGAGLMTRSTKRFATALKAGTMPGRLFDVATAATYTMGNFGLTVGEIMNKSIGRGLSLTHFSFSRWAALEPAIFAVSNLFNTRRAWLQAVARHTHTGQTGRDRMNAVHRLVSNPSWVLAGSFATAVSFFKTGKAVAGLFGHLSLHNGLATVAGAIATGGWSRFTKNIAQRSVLEVLKRDHQNEKYDDLRVRRQLGLSREEANRAEAMYAQSQNKSLTGKLTAAVQLDLERGKALAEGRTLNNDQDALDKERAQVRGDLTNWGNSLAELDRAQQGQDRFVGSLTPQDVENNQVSIDQTYADLDKRRQTLEARKRVLDGKDANLNKRQITLGTKRQQLAARDLKPRWTPQPNWNRPSIRGWADNETQLRKATAVALTVSGLGTILEALFEPTGAAKPPHPKLGPRAQVPSGPGAANGANAGSLPVPGARYVVNQAIVRELAGASATSKVLGTAQQGAQLQVTGKRVVHGGHAYDEVVIGRNESGLRYGWVLADQLSSAPGSGGASP